MPKQHKTYTTLTDLKNGQRWCTKTDAAIGRIIGVTGATVGNWRKKYVTEYTWNRFHLQFNYEYLPPIVPENAQNNFKTGQE